MLVQLEVKNFALIESIAVELEWGLNVITGETGAGKSLFVDAAQVALGGRASHDFIRSGSDRSEVRALFVLNHRRLPEALAEKLALDEENTVLIERELRREGANRARINGRLASVNTIDEFASYMVELHGQHEQHRLLRADQQRALLDALGGETLEEERRQVADQYAAWRAVQEELTALLGDDAERARRLDFLRYQVQEIEAAELSPEEERELRERRKILGNLDQLREGLAEGMNLLSEGDPMHPALIEQMGQLVTMLGRLSEIDQTLEPAFSTSDGLQQQLQDLGRDLREHLDQLPFDPNELETIQERLQGIADLKRKYGATIADVLAYGDQARAEIERIESSEKRIEELKAKQEELEGQLANAAVVLSERRQETAQWLEVALIEALSDLQMEETQFEVAFEWPDDKHGIRIGDRRVRCSPHGADEVGFLISPNPGEPLMPLGKVASGGELARIMLALKNIAADADDTPTLIFDEIDAGVGGKAGQAVARKLASLARTHQVLCVTHLPQIAALADNHYHLRKRRVEGRTVTELLQLSGDDRVDELARMLGGDADATGREHARRLLAGGVNPS